MTALSRQAVALACETYTNANTMDADRREAIAMLASLHRLARAGLARLAQNNDDLSRLREDYLMDVQATVQRTLVSAPPRSLEDVRLVCEFFREAHQAGEIDAPTEGGDMFAARYLLTLGEALAGGGRLAPAS